MKEITNRAGAPSVLLPTLRGLCVTARGREPRNDRSSFGATGLLAVRYELKSPASSSNSATSAAG